MNVKINQVLTNGMIAALKDDYVAGFIIGALDHNFQVSMPGSVYASRNRVKIMAHTGGDERSVIVFYRAEDPMNICALQDFQWHEIDVHRSSLYYRGRFICKTT